MAALPLLALAVLILYIWRLRIAKGKIPPGARPLPGPRCYPIIGRIHDVPVKSSWIKFYEWSKEYGPIYKTEVFGTVHVWISSEQVAHDLLARRAAIYSDRPQIPNLPDNRTKGDYLALTGRNETWKRQRKLAQQLMTANASLHTYPTIERDRFLYLMSTDPSQYREYIEQFTSRTVARLTWGSPHSAERLRETTAGLLVTISPAGALPNFISWLMYLPTFLSPWKQEEAARHAAEAQLLRDNVRYAHERIIDGTVQPSFIHSFLKNTKLPGDRSECVSEVEASYVIGQMAIAGALTIGSPIQSFILAMLHYPRWQARLQREIDEVCRGACPQWADREKLPILRAVVKEVIRWRPPVPTGIPHAIEQDDVYNGYFIPAGATIHALEWAMTRDEITYPDPDTFNPGRWIESHYPTYKEPLTEHPKLSGFSQFGFGRRTCQGIPLVEQDLYLAMGGLAWAFDLRKKRGADGLEIPVHWNDFTPLLIAKPMPFQFDAIVRDESKRRDLRDMWETGKGEDDIAKEITITHHLHKLYNKVHPYSYPNPNPRQQQHQEPRVDNSSSDVLFPLVFRDDALSDRGSDTSGQSSNFTAAETVVSSEHLGSDDPCEPELFA